MSNDHYARKIKRIVHARPHRIVVRPAPGFLPETADEIRVLLDRPLTATESVRSDAAAQNAPKITVRAHDIAVSRISFRDAVALTMRAVMAADIWLSAGRGTVHSRAELESQLAEIDWELYLRNDVPVRVTSESRASALYHEGIVEDVIASSLRRRGIEVGENRTEVAPEVIVTIFHDRFEVWISLAGAPLWQ